MTISERLLRSSGFRYLALQLFLLFLSSVSAVNRDNFKTCKQSSFCNRQRELKVDALFYSVVPSSITLTSSGLIAVLSKHNGNQNLTLDISYLSFSTFRITVDEPSVEQKRYRLEVGDSLRADPKSQPIDVIFSTNHLSLVGKLGDQAVLHYDPFSIEFYVDGSLVCQVNRRNLFNFEEKGDPPTPTLSSTVTQEPSISTEYSELPESTEDAASYSPSPPIEHSDVTDGPHVDGLTESLNEDTNREGATEASSTPEHVVKDPHPWAESFNEHRDTRPYGPSSISMDIDFPGVAHVYGLPEHADSYVLKDTTGGDPYRLYNLDVFEYELDNQMALYGAVPVLWALSANYTTGIFWHNPSETWVDIEYTDRPTSSFLSKIPRLFSKTPERMSKTRWMSETGVLDVFVMLGRDPQAISKAYSYLTGSTPLPPLFALAYHQSRWNYNDQEDVMSIDKRFDEHQIPLDVIWLDIEHTDGKRYFTWDKPKFQNPGEMVDSLKEKGRKLVTVVDPHIKQDTAWGLYNDGVANNYFVKTWDNSNYIGWCWPGSSAWPDFMSPRVRQWWAQQFLSYDPIRTDTMFTWNDMGEPSVFSGPEVTMVKDALHAGNREHRDIHNVYGLQVHRSTWEGQLLRSHGQERPFVLTRAFFAGSQRTAAVWTGDNKACWGHLRISVPMMLSLSITGITLCGADVGGFFGNTEPELLVRWYQAGAYQPFFRAHKHMDTKRHEPWTLPDEHFKIVRAAIIERYKLLPYWYTMFARAEVDGQPVMAPIWYHFRHLTSVYDMDNEYMIGEALLVRPVTSEGARTVDVYFPPGVWYHYASLQPFVGDQWIQFPVDLSTIPAFYRGGWIIPRRERIRRSSWLMRNDPFTIFVFLDPTQNNSHGYLYLDDYHSISRDSARFYRIDYLANQDPTTHTFAGGRLRISRIPLPGTNALRIKNDEIAEVIGIERFVFVGLPLSLERVTVIHKSGDRKNLEFHQPPTQLDDKRFHGTLTAGVATVRPTDLTVSEHWELHLVTGRELKAEL